MKKGRVTIYDIAKELNLSPSYISKALNNHPTISEKVKRIVKSKARELNYSHNSYAANLRKGKSQVVGVIVPFINSRFFADAIAGIEEICSQYGYGLIICQSKDSYQKECETVDTLVGQNVECIFISIAAETSTSNHLQNVLKNNIKVIQFDRFIEGFQALRVINDNESMAYQAIAHLIDKGYNRIAFLGGSDHLSIFKLRKKGYIEALKAKDIPINKELIFENALLKEKVSDIATQLLSSHFPPNAFFTVTDSQALTVLQTAKFLKIKVPQELGIIGSGNDRFTELTTPSITAIEQSSRILGKRAAEFFFDLVANAKDLSKIEEEMIPTKIIIRESTAKN